MAPSERTSTNNTSKTTRRTTRRTTKTKTTRRTRQQSRKEENDTKSKQLECFSTQDSSSKEKDLEISEVIDVSNNNNNSSGSCCSTPKGKKFKIPEISTCPPAPKKQRVLSNFSLRRSPLSFFVPPDLEHFFMVAST